MKQWSRQIIWTLFAIAIVVLVATAFAAFATTSRFATSEQWVSHTQEVQKNLAQLNAEIQAAVVARLSYLTGSDPDILTRYHRATQNIPQELTALRKLTADNPPQQERLDALLPQVDRTLQTLQESTALIQNGANNAARQRELTATATQSLAEIERIFNQMWDEEARLLGLRRTFSHQTFNLVRTALTLSFIAVVLLISVVFYQLLMELRERQEAEAAVRLISARILQVQDMERRKVVRELHDGLGQLLSALQMDLAQLEEISAAGRFEDVRELATSLLRLAGEAVTEARTISYLLHPPLLEELGFASAAQWYVQGFSQRSNIDVKCDIAANLPRMSQETELVLFRVLQESLTNIHKHSGSSAAEFSIRVHAGQVVLTVKDNGKGIPSERLREFRNMKSGMGVGLAGMRERVNELGGKIEIDSSRAGTLLRVTIPLANEKEGGRPSERAFKSETLEEEKPAS
jgi:signal transduction histidine kinase